LAAQVSARQRFQGQLRALIRREYRSQTAFSERVGLTPGRVAQLLGPQAETLGYPLLERILDAFPRIEDQLSLYAAWRSAFAPAPELAISSAGAGEDELESCLLECRRLLELGQVSLVSQAARRIWLEQRSRSERVCLALAAAGLLVECLLIQDRFPAGLAVARNMEQLATRAGEPVLTVRSLWHQALATRLLAGEQPALAEPAFLRMRECLEAHYEGRVAKTREWRDLRQSLVRDETLLIWHQCHNSAVLPVRLAVALEALEGDLADADDPGAITLGYEIVARSQILLGRYDQASRTVACAETLCPPEQGLLTLKIALAKISLLMGTGDMADAWDLTEQAIGTAERYGLMHYRVKVGRFQRTIVMADLGRRFVSM
jgi:hypothetical protein